MPEQNYENHARIDWRFHYVVVPITFIATMFAVWNLARTPSFATAIAVLSMLGALFAVFLIRVYALQVQDRLIRLEEQLRMERVLPEHLKARIPELTVDQFVGLRFASDAELAELVEKTLANKWTRKEIKKNIRNWRPDYFRV